jgi:peptide chain release factor 1
MPKNTVWRLISRSKATFDLIILSGDEKLLRPLLQEAGGHRWQRIPPTERKGRVHTSTVTVAAFEVKPQITWCLRDADIEIFIAKDSGPGGQHRNKVESCVVIRHLPTGIEAKAAARCQHANRRAAREMLEARVAALFAGRDKAKVDAERSRMVGSGQRGDKVRTYRAQDDWVTDHRSGIKGRLSAVKAGHLEAFFD